MYSCHRVRGGEGYPVGRKSFKEIFLVLGPSDGYTSGLFRGLLLLGHSPAILLPRNEGCPLPILPRFPDTPDKSQMPELTDQHWEFKKVLLSQQSCPCSPSSWAGQMSDSSPQLASVFSGINSQLSLVSPTAENTCQTLWTILLKTLH